MPFKSQKQWKFFFANPDISEEKAKEWARETKTEFKDLPTKVKKKKDKKKKDKKKKKKTKKSAEERLDLITEALFNF